MEAGADLRIAHLINTAVATLAYTARGARRDRASIR